MITGPPPKFHGTGTSSQVRALPWLTHAKRMIALPFVPSILRLVDSSELVRRASPLGRLHRPRIIRRPIRGPQAMEHRAAFRD